MSAILAVATVQSWFLAALLAMRRDRRPSDGVLVLWLALLGAHTGVYYAQQLAPIAPSWVTTASSAFPFLQGPLLYFYVDTATSGRRRPRASYAWHLIPALCFLAYLRWFLSSDGAPQAPGGVRTLHILSVSRFFSTVLLLSVPGYVVWSLVAIRRYRRRLAETVSTSDRINLSWLRTLVAGLGFVWVAVIAVFLIRSATLGRPAQAPTHLVFWALAVFVYAIGFQAFRQRHVVSGPVAALLEVRAPGAAKYLKSGLPEPEARELHQRLLRHMEVEKPYLDDALDLPGLAEALGTSPNHVSQVINGDEGRSFYDFVNGYRVEAVKKRLVGDPEHRLNLLEVATACGFRSKATFNRVFKQHTGVTPGQFREGGVGS